MQGGMARPLHSPWCGTLSSPHPSSGVLFRLPSPGRSIIMAPLRTSCHRKPRTGCRSLPSFFFYDPSVYPLQGRHIMAKLIVRRNLFKGKPFKAAAYWYSVVKFPTFRRKAYGFKKQSEDHALKPVISIKYFSKFFYSQKWVFLPILTHLCGYWNICLQVPQYSDKILQNKRRPKIFHFFERLPFTLSSFVYHYQPIISADYISYCKQSTLPHHHFNPRIHSYT